MEEGEEQNREYVLTVGNIEKSNATLVDLDYNVIELPRYILPPHTKPGSIVRLTISQDRKEEERREKHLEKIQNDLQFRQAGSNNKIL
jgi:hypothetical protein